MPEIIDSKNISEFWTSERCFILEILNDPAHPKSSLALASASELLGCAGSFRISRIKQRSDVQNSEMFLLSIISGITNSSYRLLITSLRHY